MKITKLASHIYKNEDSPCPKCGSQEHYISNVTNPTINECTKCKHMWNPNTEKKSKRVPITDKEIHDLATIGVEELPYINAKNNKISKTANTIKEIVSEIIEQEKENGELSRPYPVALGTLMSIFEAVLRDINGVLDGFPHVGTKTQELAGDIIQKIKKLQNQQD